MHTTYQLKEILASIADHLPSLNCSFPINGDIKYNSSSYHHKPIHSDPWSSSEDIHPYISTVSFSTFVLDQVLRVMLIISCDTYVLLAS